MANILDSRLNEWQGALDGINGITLTDARVATNSLASLNASVSLDIVGKATLLVHLNVTVALNASTTLIVEGTVDGTNFFQMPFFIVSGGSTLGVAESINTQVTGGLGTGQYLICTSATGFRQMRVRMNAFTTAGTVIVAMRATQADYRIYAQPVPALLNQSAAPAVNTGGTITLPAAGPGLFHYITAFQCTLAMNPATAQTGAAAVFITTTNIPNTPAWAVPICGNTAISTGGLGAAFVYVANQIWSNPLKSSAANANTTFVLPAPGAACQLRGNVQYYVGA
jgi:hypothetical protein